MLPVSPFLGKTLCESLVDKWDTGAEGSTPSGPIRGECVIEG